MLRARGSFWMAAMFAISSFYAVQAAEDTGSMVKPETNEQRAGRMKWWREARFGMFIHWGPVSLTGREISWSRANSNPKCPNKGPTPVEDYDNLYKQFNPAQFNAADWAALARESGMKYVVPTVKHCDGFLLWDSPSDGYDMRSTPFKRDVAKELADAARKEGLRVGWYFSPMDWRDPDFRTERNGEFLKRMHTQLRELLTNYGQIDVLWFDYDGREAVYDQANTYKLVKGLQPQILLTNRLDLSVGNNNRQMLSPYADFYTPEQQIGAYDDTRPWETCMTLGTQWSWKPDDRIKTVPEVIRILTTCVGGDGNLLLNVGPMPDGRIEPRQVEVLKGVGAWMKQCGEAIYGTRGGPYKPTRNYASTRKANSIYLHVLNWNGTSVKLPPLPRQIVASSVLTGGTAIVQQTAGGITIVVPEAQRNPSATVIKLELDSPALEIAPIEALSASSALKATASNVYQNSRQYAAAMVADEDPETRWATDGGTKQAWIELDYGKPHRFDGVMMVELYDRTQKFALHYQFGGQWKSILAGTTIGEKFTKSFPAISAQKVRLNILEATDGPSFSEITLREAK